MRSPLFPVLLALAGASSAQATGPTGLLNDTGQAHCSSDGGIVACSAANTGDASSRPGQDGRFGRDPAAANPAASGFAKPAGSGGNDGFAFVPLKVDGAAITGNPPFVAPDPGNAASLRCVHDTVTNLIWEVKTDNATPDLQDKDWTYTWGDNTGSNCFAGSNCNTNSYINALNAASVCPVSGAGPWRLPTRRELLSIVDRGFQSSPHIDTAYFPNTPPIGDYWSSNLYLPNTWYTWVVSFQTGGTTIVNNLSGNYNPRPVRLVRSGP